MSASSFPRPNFTECNDCHLCVTVSVCHIRADSFNQKEWFDLSGLCVQNADETLFGSTPFQSETYDELMTKVNADYEITIPVNAELTAHCRELLAQLLQRSPAKRSAFAFV